MILTDPVEVLNTLAVNPEVGDNVLSARRALAIATEVISQCIETELFHAEVEDVFSLPSRPINAFTSGSVKFRLSRGFVAKDGNVAAKFTKSALDASQFLLDYKQGSFRLCVAPASWVKRLTVKYEAGFEKGNDDIAQGVPVWMKEAAVQVAVRIMHTDTQRYNAIDRRERLPDIYRLGEELLNQHHRPRMGYEFPLLSNVEEI